MRRALYRSYAAPTRPLRVSRRRNDFPGRSRRAAPCTLRSRSCGLLQERELEARWRQQPIRVDVRVIAATNRDLNAAVANGSSDAICFTAFRFSRLRFLRFESGARTFLCSWNTSLARSARTSTEKHHPTSTRKHWSCFSRILGREHIREFQNVIERSMILCETDTFSIDESWLPQQPLPAPEPKHPN